MTSDPTPQPIEPPKSKSRLRLILSVAISAGILLILFRFLDSDRLLQAIGRVSLPWYLLALVFACMSQVIDASRLTMIVRGYARLTVWQVLATRFSGFFYQFFLPGGTGGFAVRWYKMNRYAQAPASVLMAMLYDRILLAFSFAFIGGLALLIDAPFDSHPFAGAALMAYGVVFGIYAALFWAINDVRFFKFVTALPMPRLIRRSLDKLEPTVRTAAEIPVGRKLAFSVVAIVQITLRCITLAFIMKAIGVSLPWLPLVWIRCLVFCVLLIPISFSGLGTRDAVLVTMLKPYGIPPEAAIVIATLMFGVFFLLAIVGGVVELCSHQPSRNTKESY